MTQQHITMLDTLDAQIPFGADRDETDAFINELFYYRKTSCTSRFHCNRPAVRAETARAVIWSV